MRKLNTKFKFVVDSGFDDNGNKINWTSSKTALLELPYKKGPTSPVRRFTKEEIAILELQMKREGRLNKS